MAEKKSKKSKKTNVTLPVKRYYPSEDFGLTQEQVCSRIKSGLINKTQKSYSKSYFNILFDNVFTFFNLLGLIVVIALDKDQLECAIKSKFGEQENTYGYLAKFIQYEIDLPEGDTNRYITQLMTYTVAREHGYEVKNSDFFKVGIQFTLAAIIPAYIYIWLVYGC